MGRLVHFLPFETGAHITQFFDVFSSGGIRAKFGWMNRGGAEALVVSFAVLMLRPPCVRASSIIGRPERSVPFNGGLPVRGATAARPARELSVQAAGDFVSRNKLLLTLVRDKL